MLNFFKRKLKITTVTFTEYISIVNTRLPTGLFILKEGSKWVGIDNRNGGAWTKIFESKRACERWVRT